MLVGAAVAGVVLCVLAVAGIDPSLAAFAVVGVLIAAAGLACAWFLPAGRRGAAAPRQAPVRRPSTRAGDVVETLAACGVVAVLVVALVGAFRSSPWLDDTWFFWLPKGLLLSAHGLDPRLFAPNEAFDYFARDDNPLWWSIVLALVVKLSGNLDLHAINVLQWCFLVAFVAALARLLATRVRAELLWPGLLLLVAMPELLRQLQSGAADVTMAMFMVLVLLSAALWLVEGEVFQLVLLVPLAAGAMQGKGEGIPELLLFLVLLTVALRAAGRRRLALLWAGAGLALLTWVPWYLWRHAHDVPNVFSIKDSLDPAYLFDHTDRLRLGLRVLTRHYGNPKEWGIAVPAATVLSIVAWWRWRRAIAVFPIVFLAVTFAFWTWLIWADPAAEFRAAASAYRYVDPVMLAGALCVPILLEAVFRARRRDVG
jgi:hypothetical protein